MEQKIRDLIIKLENLREEAARDNQNANEKGLEDSACYNSGLHDAYQTILLELREIVEDLN